MKHDSYIRHLVLAALLALGTATASAQQGEAAFLSKTHAMWRVQTEKKYILLPVEEKSEISNINVLADGNLVQRINVRLAVDKVDYYVPLDISSSQGKKLLLDVVSHNPERNEGAISGFTCWKHITTSETFDMTNREKYRPHYHHTPAYGWMNDPNGMFYKDGTWHLYFQHNPYGSQWENMTWGHSTSTDLVNWTYEGDAVLPDALGTVFSGSAVVDKDNTAGFGKGAIVAMYTSAGTNQTQSLAYSTDNGRSFTKYDGNPVITSNVPDFRDPHLFWNEDIKKWNLILAAGQQMNIYSSANLKDWTFESCFGQGYGCHDGVWECPDLMRLPVQGTDKQKWLLLCNINPGGPFGGSATQYFVGDFDGHKFTCESDPSVTKWLDYGKDHYATVTFDNAPDGRHVALAWMSNWQYAAQVPTKQYRSANSIARDLGLYEFGGQTYASSTPSPEQTAVRGQKVNSLTDACEVVVDLRGTATLSLSNAQGEQVTIVYDAKQSTLSMDRTESGLKDFSEAFPAIITAPTNGKLSQLRLFIDHSSIEAISADGRVAVTNLVFPTTPYNKVTVKGKAKYTIYNIK